MAASQAQQNAAAEFGWMLSVINSNAELKAKFGQAVAQHWDGNRWIAEVRGTNWFRKQSDTARSWLILQQTDPATAKQRLAERVSTIKVKAAQLGVPLNAAQLRTIANQSIMLGFDETQVANHISADWTYNPKVTTKGLAGQALDAIQKTRQAYGIPVSNSGINDWLHRVLVGQATPDDFTEYAKGIAKSMFPSLTKQIDNGETVQQFYEPYRQTAAQLLGVNPDGIDWTNPKWRAPLDVVDPKTKERSFMTLADWGQKLRTDPGYGYDTSQDGTQHATGFATKLLQEFGFTG